MLTSGCKKVCAWTCLQPNKLSNTTKFELDLKNSHSQLNWVGGIWSFQTFVGSLESSTNFSPKKRLGL